MIKKNKKEQKRTKRTKKKYIYVRFDSDQIFEWYTAPSKQKKDLHEPNK